MVWGELGGWFRPGLVRSDPRGGELKKSRRNRGALHGDFHVSEANVFANYAFAFASRLRFLPADLPGSQRRERSSRSVLRRCGH